MKVFVPALFAAMIVAATLEQPRSVLTCASPERPVVNVPLPLRQPNWLGNRREGCCTFAANITALNWQGQEAKSRHIRANFGNGQTPRSLAVNLAKADVRFAWTVGERDVAFLEKALEGRRGVAVAIDEGDPNDDECHMVLLVHLDEHSACLIDNNHPTVNRWMTRDDFLREWIETGSWAVCPLYTPAPPLRT